LKLRIVPTSLREANAFVQALHRHHKPVTGTKFALAVADEAGAVRGVALVGRPVSRRLDNGWTLEVNRCCTDGARNACSMLYGACRRAARAMGHDPIYTYTLKEESGASLRAAGFVCEGEAGSPAKNWHSRPNRKALPVGDDLVGGKLRWIG
jgi:hypothetical protein